MNTSGRLNERLVLLMSQMMWIYCQRYFKPGKSKFSHIPNVNLQKSYSIAHINSPMQDPSLAKRFPEKSSFLAECQWSKPRTKTTMRQAFQCIVLIPKWKMKKSVRAVPVGSKEQFDRACWIPQYKISVWLDVSLGKAHFSQNANDQNLALKPQCDELFNAL